jgi:hypothetical protein
LYAQRPIVTKHKSYAFYHPFTEAVAGIMADLPIKFCVTTVFNIILYFLAGLRTEPSQFFIFFLFNFVSMLTMSAIFRTTAAVTKTISAALAIAGIMVLWIVIYTGFTMQRSYMHPWFKWTSWVSVPDPLNQHGCLVLVQPRPYANMAFYDRSTRLLTPLRLSWSMRCTDDNFHVRRQAWCLHTGLATISDAPLQVLLQETSTSLAMHGCSPRMGIPIATFGETSAFSSLL